MFDGLSADSQSSDTKQIATVRITNRVGNRTVMSVSEFKSIHDDVLVNGVASKFAVFDVAGNPSSQFVTIL